MPVSRGTNQQLTKSHNRGLVLQLICTNGGITRQQITKRTRLTKMTTTNIVTDLMQSGIVTEAEAKNDNVGRNPAVLAISPDAPKVIGVTVSRRKVEVVLSDMALGILQQRTKMLEIEDNRSLLSKIGELIDSIGCDMKEVLGIGVASIGQWDIRRRKLISIINFGNVRELDIGEELEKKYGRPVFVNNDMNAATMAEKLFGNGKDLTDFVYLGITNGIGAGIVTDGRLYQQSSGLAGEIGHMGIDLNGRKCPCGNRGCLELYASVPVMEKSLKEATGLDLDFERFCSLPVTEKVNEIFLDTVEKIAYALVSVTNLLNCQAVIIGNEGLYLPEVYIRHMEKLINEMKYSTMENIRVLKTAFDLNTSLYGSVCCVLHEVFEGNLTV